MHIVFHLHKDSELSWSKKEGEGQVFHTPSINAGKGKCYVYVPKMHVLLAITLKESNKKQQNRYF